MCSNMVVEVMGKAEGETYNIMDAAVMEMVAVEIYSNKVVVGRRRWRGW